MYYVYMMTNVKKNVLYTGFTGNLEQRVAEHKSLIADGFTKKYKTVIVIYYEVFENIEVAKQRERAIKKWNRAWKDELINAVNPQWEEVLIV